MELTQDQYERIAPLLPVQRGNVSIPNLQVLNALLYVAEHGCKWRGLPPRFGRWHTIYTRIWAKNGVLDRGTSAARTDTCQAGLDGQHRIGGVQSRRVGPPRFIWLRLEAVPGTGPRRTGGPKLLGLAIVMDRAYEGNETRQLALDVAAPVFPHSLPESPHGRQQEAQ